MNFAVSLIGRAGLTCLLVLLFCFTALRGQERTFQITSFTANGQPVKDFAVAFHLSTKMLFPRRMDNIVFVPKEFGEDDTFALVFDAAGFHFSFPSGHYGYIETDDVKVDLAIDIDTPPFDSKHGPARKLKNICMIYSLTGVPSVSNRPNLVVDPVTTEIRNRCPSQ